ncbi:uncharacterized protein RCO7_07065 [Rhynchosporium graminicola]|uniref:DUF7872 domain-containing protein n=1 Tax=Rhynchosporium graminicola TaxID=2792576 RepID=A0A1E1K0S8_9HELO|nr:uncharacterized protein RCO7_07065 [Rhynchosporium commune]
MIYQSLLLTALAASVLASPVPQGQGAGADSCPAEALTPDTWKKLDIDDFLIKWVEKNYTARSNDANTIQSLASTFGAPNFFCGLDSFCNAGQPCVPIDLPGWYVMVAIQNWNSYMNGVNTAVSFASSILSLTLPGIVSDFLPKTVDNVTPLKTVFELFNTVLGVVPATGVVGKGVSALNGGFPYLLTRFTPPPPTDKFLQWSNVAGSLAGVVTQYQDTISNAFENILHADPLAPDHEGIASILTGGSFLGVSRNFTSSDLQESVQATLTRAAIGAAISASGVYVLHFHNASPCRDDDVSICQMNGGSNVNLVLKHPNWDEAGDTAKTLVEKYGFTKDDFLTSVASCWNSKGKTNNFDAWGDDGLPLDAKVECVFYIPVCDLEPGKLLPGASDYIEHCAQAVKL